MVGAFFTLSLIFETGKTMFIPVNFEKEKQKKQNNQSRRNKLSKFRNLIVLKKYILKYNSKQIRMQFLQPPCFRRYEFPRKKIVEIN